MAERDAPQDGVAGSRLNRQESTMGERDRRPGVCAKEIEAIRASMADLRKISSDFRAEMGELRVRNRRTVSESRALMRGCDDLLTCQIGELRR